MQEEEEEEESWAAAAEVRRDRAVRARDRSDGTRLRAQLFPDSSRASPPPRQSRTARKLDFDVLLQSAPAHVLRRYQVAFAL